VSSVVASNEIQPNPQPYSATIKGRILWRFQNGDIVEGPQYEITVSDNCCSSHAEGSARTMLDGYLKWHNEVSINKDFETAFLDEAVVTHHG
jgi:hypothetical protein